MLLTDVAYCGKKEALSGQSSLGLVEEKEVLKVQALPSILTDFQVSSPLQVPVGWGGTGLGTGDCDEVSLYLLLALKSLLSPVTPSLTPEPR